ncbi:hypothetical protein NDN08_005774 [Rhodosorus marinus]|uniref:Plastid lipid-associated protein/fibrillin conserved domain-containing protein n=1 Tax=Rhodosorus marinus TaxID=101924 RepID=A0AAV8V4N2_9RHOD|nr:hypothetical protein NDN08_005774 [Rhodosorus marinus]
MVGFIGVAGLRSAELPGRESICHSQRRVFECRRRCIMRGSDDDNGLREQVKKRLMEGVQALAGPDRGIFGMEGEHRDRVHELLAEVERMTPHPEPTSVIDSVVAGDWRVLYTSLTILGARRTKLALSTSKKPGLVELGHIYQSIQPESKVATNKVEFSVMKVSGTFTVTATYEVESDTRVGVTFQNSELMPAMLEKLLGQNLGLLTEIFNPEGHLDITFVDDTLRIGRDHKDNIFVLERVRNSQS